MVKKIPKLSRSPLVESPIVLCVKILLHKSVPKRKKQNNVFLRAEIPSEGKPPLERSIEPSLVKLQ